MMFYVLGTLFRIIKVKSDNIHSLWLTSVLSQVKTTVGKLSRITSFKPKYIMWKERVIIITSDHATVLQRKVLSIKAVTWLGKQD